MSKKYFLFCLFIVSGCSIFQPEESTIIQPKLLQQYPLPIVNQSIYKDKFEFNCNLLVDEIGNVEKATILNRTGDLIWDSLAELSLMKWKFSPAIINGNPAKVMVRKKIVVVFERPKTIYLGEIEVDSYFLADSVYKELVNGIDFYSLVSKFSISPSKQKNGILGEVNIKLYSKEISDVLSRLDEGEFTEPLEYGDKYIIFKRLKNNI